MRKFFQIIWFAFCRAVTRILYYRAEVLGAENVPTQGPVLLCINHVNSLVDGVIVQAALGRTIRPVARKRLFDLPFTGHILNWIKAVPVYSRAYGDRGANDDGFSRLYELFEEGELIVIFPEGQSHDTPRLFPIKKGAARMVLGSLSKLGRAPTVIPVGLTYTDKDKFRRSVLLQFGEPIATDELPEGEEAQVSALTERIQSRMQNLTINAASWEELGFVMRLANFYHLREGKNNLGHRFVTLQALMENQYRLQAQYPELMVHLEQKLAVFEQLCRRYGIQDYQLDIRYNLFTVGKFLMTLLLFCGILVPLGLWGYLNNLLPRLGLKIGMRKARISPDQIDTARVLGSLFMTSIFWTSQSYIVYLLYGADNAFIYAFSLPPAATVALLMQERRKWLISNLQVFFLFLRKRELKRYLTELRTELEQDIARLVRLSRPGRD